MGTGTSKNYILQNDSDFKAKFPPDSDGFYAIKVYDSSNTLYSDAALKQRTAWLGNDASAQAPDGEHVLAATTHLHPALKAISGSSVRLAAT